MRACGLLGHGKNGVLQPESDCKRGSVAGAVWEDLGSISAISGIFVVSTSPRSPISAGVLISCNVVDADRPALLVARICGPASECCVFDGAEDLRGDAFARVL